MKHLRAIILAIGCLFLIQPSIVAGVVGTGAIGNAGVKVGRGQVFATYLVFPSESGQKADSLVVRYDDDFTSPDSVIGVIYAGTSGDVTTRLYLSTDTVVTTTTSGTPSRNVFHFSASATLTSGEVYYPGIQVLGGGSTYIYADTASTGPRTAKDSTGTPPDSPWGLGEFTSIPVLACSLYYSAAAPAPAAATRLGSARVGSGRW